VNLTSNLKVHPELPFECIDQLVTCQLPNNNPALRAKIKKFMTHSEDHLTRETSRCNRDGVCIYGYPQPLTPQTWIDEDTGHIHFKRLTEEERWIVPHIPEFIDEFDCHIYWDIVYTVHCFMYLYKYCFKGPDRVLFHIQNEDRDLTDEIKDYINGRYLSAPEAAWRILGFDITSKEPSVTCLPIHLPGQNRTQFHQGRNSVTSTASDLIRYFYRPQEPRLFWNRRFKRVVFTNVNKSQ